MAASPRPGRGVLEAAFAVLDEVRAQAPARLVDLAEATGIPRATVYRLLTQLIDVGAVRRTGTRYRLGGSVLGFAAGSRLERRLRAAAGRPVAELATRTGAGVSLTLEVSGSAVFVVLIDAREPLGVFAEPGSPVLEGTAIARAHENHHRLHVDAGRHTAGLTCVSVPFALPGNAFATMTTIAHGSRPSPGLLTATQAAAARVAELVAL
ncbi:helix-turn-helix domain-containing protein [Amycolatopsis rhabdoformis]|uniref:Helix-turn-helix domain-containing protein n=1 Tax=Amycolatopsis rhabdoformis TaxID=1448059 RepID=A0ABZ1HZM2_9PSEU|nr:helix-turn-helix domain-containing protein [Amycolatopsis rhabdoformis]WSE26813.1 helix-turn-helix domain-containing protein [Amycolatopsis rhabdoformis]